MRPHDPGTRRTRRPAAPLPGPAPGARLVAPRAGGRVPPTSRGRAHGRVHAPPGLRTDGPGGRHGVVTWTLPEPIFPALWPTRLWCPGGLQSPSYGQGFVLSVVHCGHGSGPSGVKGPGPVVASVEEPLTSGESGAK